MFRISRGFALALLLADLLELFNELGAARVLAMLGELKLLVNSLLYICRSLVTKPFKELGLDGQAVRALLEEVAYSLVLDIGEFLFKLGMFLAEGSLVRLLRAGGCYWSSSRSSVVCHV